MPTNGRRRTIYSITKRLREWNKWLASQRISKCWICGQIIPAEVFIDGTANDGILLHHVDRNRQHNSPANLVVVHRTCHRAFHKMTDEQHITEKRAKLRLMQQRQRLSITD